MTQVSTKHVRDWRSTRHDAARDHDEPWTNDSEAVDWVLSPQPHTPPKPAVTSPPPPPLHPPPEAEDGTITHWVTARGFGFISNGGSYDDRIFAHVRTIVGLPADRAECDRIQAKIVGRRVKFVRAQSDDGRFRCERVWFVD
jgi:cold shock CspA family protein